MFVMPGRRRLFEACDDLSGAVMRLMGSICNAILVTKKRSCFRDFIGKAAFFDGRFLDVINQN